MSESEMQRSHAYEEDMWHENEWRPVFSDESWTQIDKIMFDFLTITLPS